jgi:outer membrane protein TolC
MNECLRSPSASAALIGLWLSVLTAGPGAAQDTPAKVAVPANAPPAVMRLTLEEAKQRALSASKLLNMGNLNAESKAFAVRAMQADYFPKISGSVLYYHFSDDLGTVLATQGRKVTGPKGTPLLTFPATVINVAVLNEDSSLAYIGAVQPITDLLKVRQGVRIAQADEQIAHTEVEKGVRALASGVEQLYWGILAARRIRSGAAEALQGAEQLAQTKLVEARIALVETKQALEAVDKQIADLQEQLNSLLDLPLCTTLELVEPTLPVLPFHCADDVISLAVASSPDVHAAEATIQKAQAALAAGKLDYVPSIAVTGGYANQTAADYIQQDIGYIGVIGTYTFVDWGKRRNVIRERENLVRMAKLKLQQTQEEVAQKASKAYRDMADSQVALKTATDLVGLQKEAVKKATTPEAMRHPADLIKASKDLMEAEVNAVKADLAYRQAYVQLMALVGKY